jgi:hypothetical protein
MKKHMIKKISILMTALLLLICLPMTAQAEKGSTHGRATPSNMEREEVTEEPEDEAGEETEDVMVSETGEPEEELTVLEEETEAMKEAGQAETKAVTEPETKAPEAPKTKTASVTEEDISGTWTIDGVTNYQFKTGGTGSLILPEHKYAFKYNLEEDELTLKFESAKIKKAVFQVSLERDNLVLTKEEEAGTAEFLLKKTKD